MLGKMGCTYKDYCIMPVRVAFNAVKGYRLREQGDWERARFIAASFNGEAAKVKFDWEKQQAPKSARLSKNEYLKRLEKYFGKNEHTRTSSG